jgi:hypothetical protein
MFYKFTDKNLINSRFTYKKKLWSIWSAKRFLSRGFPNLKIKAEKYYENALLQKIKIIIENTEKAFVYR